MEHKVTKLPKSEIEIEITLPFEEFEPHIKKAAVLISEEHEIEGFRKGRAPYTIIKNRLGESVIYERAAELAVRKTYPQILEELTTSYKPQATSFIPIGQPEVTITKLAPGNELQFKIKLATLPEVELPDYKKIAAEVLKSKKTQGVGEEEIQKTVDWIRESRVKLVTVSRQAKRGDRVEIDFSARGGSASGGEAQDNSPILADSKSHPLILGHGKFMPGFEEELEGMAVGEEKNFSIKVPADWRDKTLAGKNINVRAIIKLVQERQIPELTDEFVKNLGNFSSLDAFLKNVKDGLLAEKEEKERQRIKSEIIEKIANDAKTDIPEVLIEKELDKMLQDLKTGVERMGMKWTDYMLHIKKTEEELRKDWRNDAEKRVKQALSLRKIADIEKISPTPEEIEERANEILKQFRAVEEAKKNIDAEELKEYAKGILRSEQVFEFLEQRT